MAQLLKAVLMAESEPSESKRPVQGRPVQGTDAVRRTNSRENERKIRLAHFWPGIGSQPIPDRLSE